MNTDHALDRLHDHQQGILDHLAAALDLMRRRPDDVRAALAKSRLELFRLLRAYQLFKHHEIFDPVLRRGTATQIAAATRMKANCIAAGDAYRTYMNLWASQDVVEAWSSFRPATLAMAQRTRAHILVERAGVPQLFAGTGNIRRTAAAVWGQAPA
ncbi:hypothetical protein Q5H91_10635 [Sphingomonas sp. KR1UV-12]|uniref:Hemerythrin-like domain-containing protein n=1 Tax=Sphingomonas aurea TaxID=3063994 RepID=A0ABT9EL39_9SPHN|nr:hypothetical protein [Sphingomonas sp. KR1UV-12]MDP1027671.1 hypothetical protein [Sphingomonas sp. KR1UV-12]